jgi:hypothetical protein
VEEREDSWRSKLDHRLRAQLAHAESSPEEGDQHVNVLVRFVGNAESLRRYGLEVRTVAGDIAIASLSLSDVPKAASAPEVLFMELSRSLGWDASREDEQTDSTA